MKLVILLLAATICASAQTDMLLYEFRLNYSYSRSDFASGTVLGDTFQRFSEHARKMQAQGGTVVDGKYITVSGVWNLTLTASTMSGSGQPLLTIALYERVAARELGRPESIFNRTYPMNSGKSSTVIAANMWRDVATFFQSYKPPPGAPQLLPRPQQPKGQAPKALPKGPPPKATKQ